MAILKKGYQRILADGTYLSIYEKYWGKGNIPIASQPQEVQKLIAKLK